MRLVDPAEGGLGQLAEQSGLHPPAVEDTVQARQRPKRERLGDVLAVALKTLWYVEEETAVETGELMSSVGQGGQTGRDGTSPWPGCSS
ncbi:MULTISPECIES: hypothetical protein [unclassified Streptomyces]|uniref:hypothetical protein n=1 Tax=unclassified Streptomyces TaxID=2593676 RepID=UPI0034206D6F